MRKGQNCYGKLATEEAIQRAKQKVEESYDAPKSPERNWLEASPPDSYGSPRYRVTIFVREGSPPKGFVIADYGHGVVMAFDAWNNLLFKWTELASKTS